MKLIDSAKIGQIWKDSFYNKEVFLVLEKQRNFRYKIYSFKNKMIKNDYPITDQDILLYDVG